MRTQIADTKAFAHNPAATTCTTYYSLIPKRFLAALQYFVILHKLVCWRLLLRDILARFCPVRMGQARRSYAFEKIRKFTCSRQFAGSCRVAGSSPDTEWGCGVAINNHLNINRFTRAASACSYAIARKRTRYRRIRYKRKLERFCGNGICVYGGEGIVDHSNCKLHQDAQHLLFVLGGDRRIFVVDRGTDGNRFGLQRIESAVLRVV